VAEKMIEEFREASDRLGLGLDLLEEGGAGACYRATWKASASACADARSRTAAGGS
jgi:hypothetical protein